MSTLLRVAAFYCFAWAVALAYPGLLPAAAPRQAVRSLELALMGANVAFAYLLWIASAAPAAARPILYAALTVFGLRAAIGTYEVLYTLDGAAALIRLIDMVLSLALFVGILNALPGALAGRGGAQPD